MANKNLTTHQLAKSMPAKIEVSDYKGRLYVFFKLPEQNQHQFSAEKLK